MIRILVLFSVSITLTVMVWAVRNFIRNEKVYKFRRYVAGKCEEYERRTGKSGFMTFYWRLPDYYDMLHLREPLKLESYFTEQEIKELLGS